MISNDFFRRFSTQNRVIDFHIEKELISKEKLCPKCNKLMIFDEVSNNFRFNSCTEGKKCNRYHLISAKKNTV